MPLITRLVLAVLLLGSVPVGALAAPKCEPLKGPEPESGGCDVTRFTGSLSCCNATACTIDVNLTPTAASCTYDFGTRAVTITGDVVLAARTLTLSAGSLVLRGKVDGRGLAGAAGGTFRVQTVGKRAPAFAMDADAAVIDLRGEAGGGTFELDADGAVQLTRGSIDVQPTPPTVAGVPPGSTAGTVIMHTTAGDLTLGIGIAASPTGFILIQTPGNFSHEASQSKITAQGGDVGIDAGGTLRLGEPSRIEVTSDTGGHLSLRGGTIQAKGRLLADGGSSVDVHAVSGVLNIDRTNDIAISAHGGDLRLTADDESVNGRVMLGGLVETFDGDLTVIATGDVTVTKKITAIGIAATQNIAGTVSLTAIHGTVRLLAPILATASEGGTVEIEAGFDVAIHANIEVQSTGGIEGDGGFGGYVTIDADDNNVVVSRVTPAKPTSPAPQILASGADAGGQHGEIEITAAGDVTLGSDTLLSMKGPSGVAGGDIVVQAGAGGLAGALTIDGRIEALAGAGSAFPSSVSLSGCDVTIQGSVDTRGHAGNGTSIEARNAVTVAGQLLSTPNGAGNSALAATALPVGAQINPPFAACDCGAGAPSVACCTLPFCDAGGPPGPCLERCRICGDGQTEGAETCDPPGCGLDGTFCSPTCQLETCTDKNACSADTCDVELGCLHPSEPDGQACNDACTDNATCRQGRCTGGTPKDVDDGNVCNGVETCDPATGPVAGEPLVCSDANPCTTNACDPVAGCTVENNTSACSDGDPCTTGDACQGGACRAGTTSCPGEVCTPDGPTFRCDACTSDDDCNDGNPCLGTRTCTDGQCVQKTAPPACATTPDTNLCDGFTYCDPQAAGDGCVTDPHPGCPDDGDACNGTFTCEPATGSCTPVAPVACDPPQDACHTVACTAATGECSETAIPGCTTCVSADDCDDQDLCTVDTCGAGRCEHSAIDGCCISDADCEDGSACTDDTCNPATNQCESIAQTGTRAGCGDSCHPDATCLAGVCDTGAIRDCADTDPCTDDACSDGTCTHDAIPECCVDASVCDDGNACSADACTDGTCAHLVADETCTPCATATDCDPRGTCAGMACVDGICVDAGVPSCDDGDLCTTDGCPGAGGCTHTARAGCCHSAAECDDGDACTDDACGGTSGCASTPRTGSALVGCRLDGVEALLTGDGIATKTRKRLTKQLGIVRKTLAAADTATGRKRTKLQARAAKQLGTLAKLVGKGAGKTIPAGLAGDLKDAVSAATSAVGALG